MNSCNTCSAPLDVGNEAYVYTPGTQHFWHPSCWDKFINPTPAQPDFFDLATVKQIVIYWPRADRQQLYVFMHDALDCRMGR